MASSRRPNQRTGWGLAETQQLLALLATSEAVMIAHPQQEIDLVCSFLQQSNVVRLMATDLLLEQLCLSISNAFARRVPVLVAGPYQVDKQQEAISVCNLARALDDWVAWYPRGNQLWSPVVASRIAGTGRYGSSGVICM